MTKIQGPYSDESLVNQRRDEPLPASHHDDSGQAAVARNEEHAETLATGQPGGPAPAEQSSPGVQPAQPSGHEPDGTGPGKAVRDMLPAGPYPQGDVPDAPAVQLAATEGVHGGHLTAEGLSGATEAGARDEEHAQDRPGPVRLVSNAVPGKPDGEVDTRP